MRLKEHCGSEDGKNFWGWRREDYVGYSKMLSGLGPTVYLIHELTATVITAQDQHRTGPISIHHGKGRDSQAHHSLRD